MTGLLISGVKYRFSIDMAFIEGCITGCISDGQAPCQPAAPSVSLAMLHTHGSNNQSVCPGSNAQELIANG
jgi:hypothetical protein